MGAYSSNMQTSIKLALGLCLLLALTNFAAASEGVELAKTDPLCEKVTKETALDTWCTEGFCSFCIVDVPGKASGAYCLYKCQEGELGKGVDLSDDRKDAAVPEKLPYIDSESASAPPPPEPTNPWDDG